AGRHSARQADAARNALRVPIPTFTHHASRITFHAVEEPMPPIRIGIIGCGAIAQVQHLPNLAGLREEFEVTAVCDRSPGLAASVAEAFHVPRHFTDYRELLASDVEAV